MELKYIGKILGIMVVTTLLTTGCSDWTEMESMSSTDLNGTTKTDQYYENLREWKKTPGLPQVFVWFDNWNGLSPTGVSSMRGLPDSVTIISNWGSPKFDLTPERKADMEYVQKVKGTKVVVTLFAQKVGDSVERQDIFETSGGSSDPVVVRPAIKAYAEAIYDNVEGSGYDGFDWDYEPDGRVTVGEYLWENKVQRTIFVEELSYWFGKGATDPNRDRGDRKPVKRELLFLIDGAVGSDMDKDWVSHYIDFYVAQAYAGKNMAGKIKGVIESLSKWIEAGEITADEVVRRTILTENFESYASTGGKFFDMAKYIYKGSHNIGGETINVDHQIGGCGIYRVGFDYNQGKGDYNGSPEYYFLRQGITYIYKTYRERQQASTSEGNNDENN